MNKRKSIAQPAIDVYNPCSEVTSKPDENISPKGIVKNYFNESSDKGTLMMIPGRMGVSILVGAIVVNIHLPLSNCKFPLLPKSEKTRGASNGRTLVIPNC